MGRLFTTASMDQVVVEAKALKGLRKRDPNKKLNLTRDIIDEDVQERNDSIILCSPEVKVEAREEIHRHLFAKRVSFSSERASEGEIKRPPVKLVRKEDRDQPVAGQTSRQTDRQTDRQPNRRREMWKLNFSF